MGDHNLVGCCITLDILHDVIVWGTWWWELGGIPGIYLWWFETSTTPLLL